MARAHILHAIQGRLRLKVATIKQDPLAAAAVADHIGGMPGVRGVTTNAITGSLIVTYDPRELSQATVIEQLTAVIGAPIQPARPRRPRPRSHLPRHIARVVVQSAMEAAIQRALLALI